MDGLSWFSLPVTPIGGGMAVTSASAAGLWLVSVAGLGQVRCRLAGIVLGAVTVSGVATVAEGSAVLVAATAVNLPAIITSGGDVLAANNKRKGWSIQNCGTNPLFVQLASGASATVFHVILRGCAVADDGSGGFLESDGTYTGIVSATGTSPRLVVMELT